MSESLHDVRPEQYAMVIREMIRHENDVTNHRIMWMLIGQGFIANAYVSAKTQGALNDAILLLAGILVALSAFLMLYKSYHARGYLEFLGQQAKQGALHEEDLPLTGWPRRRTRDWWRGGWARPWVGQAGDLLEPWVFLPWLFVFMWMTVLLKSKLGAGTAVALALGAILAMAALAACGPAPVSLRARIGTPGP
jgi:hypothetical protein